MAEQEEVASFTADTSQYVAEMDAASKSLDRLTAAAQKVRSAQIQFDESGNAVAGRVKVTTDTINDLSVGLVNIEGEWKAVSASITENTQKLAENTREARAAAKAQSELEAFRRDFPGAGLSPRSERGQVGQGTRSDSAAVADEISRAAKINQEIADHAELIDRKSREKRLALVFKQWDDEAKAAERSIKHQQELRRKQEDDETASFNRRTKAYLTRLENQTNAEVRSIQEKEAREEDQFQRAIARAKNRVALEAKADLERIGLSNKAQAEAVSKSLIGTAQPFFQGQSPEALLRFSTQVSKVHDLIASGQITAVRATEVMNQALQGQAAIFSGVEREVAKSAVAMTNFSDESQKATNSLNLTLGSLARIALIQVLHRAIYTLIDALRNASREAITFQKEISLIRTISQDSQLSFAQWTTQTRALSDEFNRPILDVARATYEAISNQITKGAESSRFMSEALKFSQATNATTAQSVDLLSSAINAYKLNANDAGRISAIMFKTIDLGRVKAEEMAQTFGRVAVPASELGISIEEVSAAIATLTINGVKTSEAFTQINSLLVSLLKPSQDMTKIFKEWGVTSGESAIATFGFSGVLEKLGQATQGSTTELAKLIRNARGLRGALALTGPTDFAGFEATLKKITESSDSFQKAIAISTESAGFKIEAELNKVKNFLINDFATNFLKTISNATDSIGGLTGAVSVSIKVAAIAAQTYALYQIKILAVSAAKSVYAIATRNEAIVTNESAEALRARFIAETEGTISTTASTSATVTNTAALRAQAVAANLAKSALGGIGKILTSPIVIIAGIVALNQYVQQLRQNTERAAEDTLSSLAIISSKQLDIIGNNLDKARLAEEQSINARFQAHLQFAASVQKVASDLADVQIAYNKRVEKALKIGFESTISSLEGQIKDLEKLSKGAIAEIEKSQKDLDATFRRQADKSFSFKLALAPDDQKENLISAKIEELRKLSAKSFGEGNLEDSRKQLDEALELINERSTRILELRRKIAENEKKQAELNARAKAKAEIEAENEELENARTNPTGKNRNIQAARRTIIDARDEIKDAENLRRIAQERKDLEDEHAKLIKQYGAGALLPAIEDEKRQQDAINAILTEKVRLNQEIKKSQDAIADAAQKEADARKAQLDTFREISKAIIDLDPKKAKTLGDRTKLLADFDRLTGELTTQGGLKDQSLLFKLLEQRANFAKQLDAEVTTNRIKENTKALEDAKTKEEQLTNARTAAEKTSAEQKIRALDTLQAQFAVIVALQKEFSSSSALSLINDRFIPQLVSLTEDLKKGPISSGNLKQLSDLVKLISQIPAEPEGFTVKEPTLPGGKPTTLADTFKDMKTAIDELKKSQDQTPLQKIKADMAATEAQVKLLNDQLKQAKDNLDALKAGQPTVPEPALPRSFAPATPSFIPTVRPDIIESAATTNETNQTNINNPTIVIQSSGVAAVDAQELWSEFERLARRGEIRMNT
jgi:TP901 family phage tail tape measure protein